MIYETPDRCVKSLPQGIYKNLWTSNMQLTYSSSPAGTFLGKSLLRCIILESLLDLFSLIFELKLNTFVILIVIVDVVAKDILSRGTYTTILCLGVVCITQEVLCWLDTDVLVKELLGCILIHEVTSID